MKFMFWIAVLMACVAMLGCNEKPPEAVLKRAAEERLSLMYQELATCSELAKCMGYKEGRVEISRIDYMDM